MNQRLLAGRMLEPVILKMFMDRLEPFCQDKQKVKMTVPKTASLVSTEKWQTR